MTEPNRPLTGEALSRLRSLLACPTAPFREGAVLDWARRQLTGHGVPFCEDQSGNLIVGVGSLTAYGRLLATPARRPLPVLMAHTDHPGFHGRRWLAPDRLAIDWHGGGPLRHLEGARVWLAGDGDTALKGRLERPELTGNGRALRRAEIRLDASPSPTPGARSLFGGLDFRAPSWRAGHRIYTRAVDDLAGVFAIVETACGAGRQRPARWIGLLTRAEEVGFVGAIAHLEQGWLQRAKRPVVCVSLEASRHRPGAEIGKGPVVRLGDRSSVYSSSAARRLELIARKVLPGAHQRLLMDGGSCEASATIAYGLPSIGVAVPLGNYHNQSFDGGQDAGPDGGPAPEFAHLADLNGMVTLCRGIVTARHVEEPWAVVRAQMARRLRKYSKLL